MDVIHFPDDPRPARWTQPVLALGNFDGVHRGHRKILDRVKRVATEHGATSVVMTFDPHPPRIVRPDKAPPLLTADDGVRWIVLDALRHRPHSTHFSLNEAVAVARQLGVERAYFTHISHDLGHRATNAQLPDGIELAYDGLALEIP